MVVFSVDLSLRVQLGFMVSVIVRLETFTHCQRSFFIADGRVDSSQVFIIKI